MTNNSKQPINVSQLASIFDDVTTSYKFLFFKGLLNQLKNNEFNSNIIDVDEVMIDMIAFAWYPSTYFMISLGKQDQINNVLKQVKISQRTKNNFPNLRKEIKNQILQLDLPDLLRLVPYRLLTAFYSDELKGLLDYQRNNALHDISIKTFETKKPLYKFIDDKHLMLHSDWIDYLKENIALVEGWFSWNWLQYLQKNNSNVPNLSEKISPTINRKPITKQTEFWGHIIKNFDVKCIYTNKKLTLDNYELDHYLPWSFVAHDKLWNLVPVTKNANRDKSDRLPQDSTLDAFIKLQHLALTNSKTFYEAKAWQRLIESYKFDLKIENENLENIDLKELEKALKNIINPLKSLAKSMGFGSYKHGKI